MEIGIDCITISQFDEKTLHNLSFLKKIFTRNETKYCKKKAKPSQHFAVRFAGKEAVIKALSHFDIKIPLNQIEILNNTNGSPFVRILEKNLDLFKIKISLSHSRDVAMAVAIVSKSSKMNE